jgi:phosphatidylglycerophosphate synthase
LANRITVSRFPLLVAYVLILYWAPPAWRLAAVALLFVGLMLDTVDGMIARRSGQTTLIGSVLDIAADRMYELVLWVCFADLRLIPVAIPLIVIMRTTLTDAFRSIGVAQGQAPFKQHQSRLGRFLVASGAMRASYSVSKIVAFLCLAGAEALRGFDPATGMGMASAPILQIARILAWIAVVLCLLRGLPVIAGALRRYWDGTPDPGGTGPA